MESAENKVIIKLVRQAENQGSSTWTVISAEGVWVEMHKPHRVCKPGCDASGTLCSTVTSSHLELRRPPPPNQLSTEHALTDSGTQEGRLVSVCPPCMNTHVTMLM